MLEIIDKNAYVFCIWREKLFHYFFFEIFSIPKKKRTCNELEYSLGSTMNWWPMLIEMRFPIFLMNCSGWFSFQMMATMPTIQYAHYPMNAHFLGNIFQFYFSVELKMKKNCFGPWAERIYSRAHQRQLNLSVDISCYQVCVWLFTNFVNISSLQRQIYRSKMVLNLRRRILCWVCRKIRKADAYHQLSSLRLCWWTHLKPRPSCRPFKFMKLPTISRGYVKQGRNTLAIQCN